MYCVKCDWGLYDDDRTYSTRGKMSFHLSRVAAYYRDWQATSSLFSAMRAWTVLKANCFSYYWSSWSWCCYLYYSGDGCACIGMKTGLRSNPSLCGGDRDQRGDSSFYSRARWRHDWLFYCLCWYWSRWYRLENWQQSCSVGVGLTNLPPRRHDVYRSRWPFDNPWHLVSRPNTTLAWQQRMMSLRICGCTYEERWLLSGLWSVLCQTERFYFCFLAENGIAGDQRMTGGLLSRSSLSNHTLLMRLINE